MKDAILSIILHWQFRYTELIMECEDYL